MPCPSESHPSLAVKNADAERHIAVSLLRLLAVHGCSACDYTYTRFLWGAILGALDQERPEAWVDKLILKDAPDLLQHE